MIVEMATCLLRPCREVENQSASRYMGLKPESVSGATHLRSEGCGEKGLISHSGFSTEPLGGFREWWQSVAAGSEQRHFGGKRVCFVIVLLNQRCSL